jgi:hypothetical protein
VWGKVILTIPYIGYGVEAARKPIGFIFLVIIPAGVVIIDELRKIALEILGMQRKRRAQGATATQEAK